MQKANKGMYISNDIVRNKPTSYLVVSSLIIKSIKCQMNNIIIGTVAMQVFVEDL